MVLPSLAPLLLIHTTGGKSPHVVLLPIIYYTSNVTNSEITLVIADDNEEVLRSMQQYLGANERIKILGAFLNGRDAWEFLKTNKVDLILSDIHMPVMDGAMLLNKLQQLAEPPKFLSITSLDRDDAMIKILRLGGVGYVLKSQRPHEIVKAVVDAVDGGTTVAPQALHRLVHYLPNVEYRDNGDPMYVPSIEKLTGTEKSIVSLLCQGWSNSEIATELHFSESTVKRHISNIMVLFRARSRLELVAAVLNPTGNSEIIKTVDT